MFRALEWRLALAVEYAEERSLCAHYTAAAVFYVLEFVCVMIFFISVPIWFFKSWLLAVLSEDLFFFFLFLIRSFEEARNRP